MSAPRVFLADDHGLLLDAFSTLLKPHCEVVGTARDGAELLERAPALAPDVVVLDITMPKLNGIDAARKLRALLPRTKFVFLTVSEDPEIAADALDAVKGASFLLKAGSGSELLQAIEAAQAGRTYITPRILDDVLHCMRHRTKSRLTPRQREVLQLLAEGKSMKEVAYALGITTRTVVHHKYAMMESLGVDNFVECIRYAVRSGLTT